MPCLNKESGLKEGLETIIVDGHSKGSTVEIAELVSEEMNLKPKFRFTGGERGWKGDVPVMLLSIEKLKSLGWQPKYSSKEAVRNTIKALVGHDYLSLEGRG